MIRDTHSMSIQSYKKEIFMKPFPDAIHGIIVLLLALTLSATSAAGITFSDPAGDDDGPGTYIYPTDKVYSPGSFDLTRMVLTDSGKTVTLEISVGAKLENPWNMASGFSIQMAQLYIDTDGITESGHQPALPGMNALFLTDCFWEKAIIISPQPASRVLTEIKTKAAHLENDIIVPIKVSAQGKTIRAIIRKQDLGSDISDEWGFQLLLSSNEGFPESHEILCRRVNEYEGTHRFGGGSDYDGDPHFMDIFCPPATGSASEISGQHEILSKYKSNPDNIDNLLVLLPMVRIGQGAADIPPVRGSEDTRISGFQFTRTPPPSPSPQNETFGLSIHGKVFTNWLYGNDVSEYSVYLDPFGDGGHNGTNSELELEIRARVSDYVEAGARIKNRFRTNYWSTYWENDDLDGAQYMKLRGVWARFRPPQWAEPILQTVHVGSSDLGMFNPWTVGRVRYIDRDNAMGVFLSGTPTNTLSYDLARISLPERWAGPGWETRGNGFYTADGFATRDYAFAAALNLDLSQAFRLRLLGDYTIDREGDPDDNNERNGVDLVERFQNTVGCMEFTTSPAEFIEINGLAAYAETTYKAAFDYIEKKGANNMPQKNTSDPAFKLLVEIDDPFGIGLGFACEYFNIGEEFISLMASRRENDVLITEGFEGDDAVGAFDWGGWWGTMGQTPTLNVDNNETQFDETAYQTIVGWNGGTFSFRYGTGSLDLSGEYTRIDYNTNMQGRDMTIYPGGKGFGDPANAYNEYQERATAISVIKGNYTTSWQHPIDLSFRIKNLNDKDDRNLDTREDDYANDKWIYDFGIGFQLTDELLLQAGYTIYDKEITLGNQSFCSQKNRIYFSTRYTYGGIKIGYAVEQFTGEDWDDEYQEKFDDFELIRSRAFLEVSF